MELSDYKGWRKRQAEMRAEGRHVGIGVCTCQERSVFSATEFWFWFDEPVAAPVTSAPESVTLKVDAMGAGHRHACTPTPPGATAPRRWWPSSWPRSWA